MIFVSIALLVVAALGLGIGIASSSVPPLVVSIVATFAAVIVLWSSFVHYRKEAAAQGQPVTGLGGNRPRQPGYPEVYTADEQAVPTNGRPKSVVPDDWDSIHEVEAVELVSTFNLDELHELRRHEVENAARPNVLSAIDERITGIVSVRRRRSST